MSTDYKRNAAVSFNIDFTNANGALQALDEDLILSFDHLRIYKVLTNDNGLDHLIMSDHQDWTWYSRETTPGQYFFQFSLTVEGDPTWNSFCEPGFNYFVVINPSSEVFLSSQSLAGLTVYRFSIENRTTGTLSVTVQAAPVQEDLTDNSELYAFVGETRTYSIPFYHLDPSTGALDLDNPYDFRDHEGLMQIVVEGPDKVDVATTTDVSIVEPVDPEEGPWNRLTFPLDFSAALDPFVGAFALRNTETGLVLAAGVFTLRYAAMVDPEV